MVGHFAHLLAIPNALYPLLKFYLPIKCTRDINLAYLAFAELDLPPYQSGAQATKRMANARERSIHSFLAATTHVNPLPAPRQHIINIARTFHTPT